MKQTKVFYCEISSQWYENGSYFTVFGPNSRWQQATYSTIKYKLIIWKKIDAHIVIHSNAMPIVMLHYLGRGCITRTHTWSTDFNIGLSYVPQDILTYGVGRGVFDTAPKTFHSSPVRKLLSRCVTWQTNVFADAKNSIVAVWHACKPADQTNIHIAVRG